MHFFSRWICVGQGDISTNMCLHVFLGIGISHGATATLNLRNLRNHKDITLIHMGESETHPCEYYLSLKSI